MVSMAFRGVVHGKTIELDSEPELPDGQEVSVTLLTVGDTSATSIASTLTDAERRWAEAEVKNLMPGEGLKLSFGAWAEDAKELNEYFDMNRQHKVQYSG